MFPPAEEEGGLKALGLGEKWGRSGEKRRRDKKILGPRAKNGGGERRLYLERGVFLCSPPFRLCTVYGTLCVLAINSTLVRTKA